MDRGVPVELTYWKPLVMLAGAVAMIDVPAVRHGLPTISSAFRALPKWVSCPLSIYLLAHLYGRLPYKADVFSAVGRALTPNQGAASG